MRRWSMYLIYCGVIVLFVLWLYANSRDREQIRCPYHNSHIANVTYYNPDIDASESYELVVEVQDCRVIEIYFPKRGHLGQSRFKPSKLDEDGKSVITDNRGRTFFVEIIE